MPSRSATPRNAAQGGLPTSPIQSAPAKKRFEDGFGSVSTIATLLTEITFNATREQIERKEAQAIEAMSEFAKKEMAYLKASSLQLCGEDMTSKIREFDDRTAAFTKTILDTAQTVGWPITDRNGVPKTTLQRHGLVKVSLVRDWFAEGRAPLHAKYAQALDDALQDAIEKEAQQVRSNKLALKTGEIAKVFSFLSGLEKALSDVNNHQWLLRARVTRGRPRHAATWCPLEVAEAIAARKGHEHELRWAFANEPLLLPWRDAWQRKFKDRNAFGR